MFSARYQNGLEFRKIIEAIKDLVNNVTIDITNQGLKLQAMDSTHIAYICLMIKDKAFGQNYQFVQPHTIGLKIENLHKILKLGDTNSSLTLSLDQQPDSLKLKFQSPNGLKITTFNLGLFVYEQQGLGIPESNYSCTCTMSSAQFNRICKQFGNLAEDIRIQMTKQYIRFSIDGQMGNGEIKLMQTQTHGTQNIILDVQQNVSYKFAARYLHLFSKAMNLSNQVVINMAKDTPLMILFAIANGNGHIKYYLAPKVEEPAQN